MNAPADRGKEAIRRHFTPVDSIPEWTIISMEIDGGRDLAYARIFLTVTAHVGGAGVPLSYAGKQLAVLRRQRDGSWRIVTDMRNADGPPGQ
jgi:ketosteroid isomerase-like protein